MKSYVRIKFEIINCEYSLKACFEIVKSALSWNEILAKQTVSVKIAHYVYRICSIQDLQLSFC